MPPLRLPPPLPCAIALAVAIALLWRAPARPLPPRGSTPDDRIDDTIEGIVGGPVVAGEHGLGAPLDTGSTTVWLWTDAPIAPGQSVVAVGLLRTPRGFLAPGSPDRALLVATRGATWELDARTLRVVADEPGVVARIWRAAGATQRTLSARLPGDTPAGAALRGIVTGDRSRIPEVLDDRWRVAGIFHVLSVSGLHLAVIAGLAFALLRKLIAASPWGGRTRPARWAAPIALVLAIAYTLVTGAELATVRALVVVAVALVGQMLDRPLRLVDALGIAAIAILAWRPCDVFDASFQLSFVAALTLALRPRQGHWLRRGLMTSLWVAVTTAPITALHFQQVAAGGVVGNLVLTPIVELAALPLGLAGSALGSLGSPLVTLATWLVHVVDVGAGLLGRAVPVGAIAIGSPVIMAALVTGSLVLGARARRTRADALLLAALCIGWATSRRPPPSGVLRVTFVDVGQGDAAVVELPGGETWLVDAGGLASAGSAEAASSPGVAIDRLLGVYGKTSIELAILSHPHPDHYLGLGAITRPIRELWFAADTDDHGVAPAHAFGSIAHALSLHGTHLVRPVLGTTRTTSGVDLTVWGPRTGDALAPDPVRGVNDNSLVVEIEYAGRTFLFAGDLEAEGEAALVEAGLPHVDVVKVPHHGSPTSSTAAFVAATAPVLAVISCGAGNAFGFPSPDVVARWEANGADVARTDRDGSVTVSVDSDGAMTIDRFRRYRGPRP